MARRRQTTPRQIVEEASDWLVKMREPSVSAEDREAFAQWLRASPVNVGAYLEVARLWAHTALIDPDFPADLAAAAQNVVPLPRAPPATGPGHGNRAGARWRLWALTASMALIAAGSLFGWWHYAADTYTTEIAEQRVLTLEDGSIIRLNSRSKLRVRMNPNIRELELTAGQALFEVAHDAYRPFIVRGGNVSVRAVGTQFDVNLKHSGTVVTVVEGRVKVDADEGASSPGPAAGVAGTLLVAAGEQVRVAPNGTVRKPKKTDTAAATGWLHQELRFDDQPLGDVLEEFNRYTHVPLVLSDPTLANLRINAVFHSTNPESLLHYLAGLQGVLIERTAHEIRISRRS